MWFRNQQSFSQPPVHWTGNYWRGVSDLARKSDSYCLYICSNNSPHPVLCIPYLAKSQKLTLIPPYPIWSWWVDNFCAYGHEVFKSWLKPWEPYNNLAMNTYFAQSPPPGGNPSISSNDSKCMRYGSTASPGSACSRISEIHKYPNVIHYFWHSGRPIRLTHQFDERQDMRVTHSHREKCIFYWKGK